MKRENTRKSTFGKLGLAIGGVVLASSSANAALDVSGIALDVGQVEVIGLTIMGALATIWVVKKVISML